MNRSVSLRNSAGQWDCGEDPLNFFESGWWGRILSAINTLILFDIGLLFIWPILKPSEYLKYIVRYMLSF